MKKIPNITTKQILEVKRKFGMGIEYYILRRDYGISYNDINKINDMFKNCEFEDDIIARIDEIKRERELKRIRKYKENYQRNKAYFLEYSKQAYARKIELTLST